MNRWKLVAPTFYIVFLMGVEPCGADTLSPEAVTLSPEDAVDLAFSHHRDAERIRLTLQEDRMNARESRLRLMPRLNLNLTLPSVEDYRSEVWTTVDDSLKLVWQDWNLREERGALSFSSELPFGTDLDFSASAWQRESDTGSIQQDKGQSYSLNVHQNLLPSRTLYGDLLEAASTLDLREESALDQMAGFRFRVLTSYYRMHQTQEAAELTSKDRMQAEQNLKRSQERLQAGLIAESDYLKIELEALRQEANFQSDSLALHQQAISFRQLIGLEPDETFFLKAPQMSPYIAPSFEEVWTRLLGSNVRLKQQRHAQVLASRTVKRRRLERLPDLGVSASWSLYGEDETFQWFPENAGINRSFRVDLRFPLLDGGSGRRALTRARLAERRQTLAFEEEEERLKTQVYNMLAELQDLSASARLLIRQLNIAERDLELSRERHERGLITSQDWIEASRSLSRVRLSDLQNRVSLHLAQLELNRLTGLDCEALRSCLN